LSLPDTYRGFGILCLIPHADSERFPAAQGDKRDFVLKSSEVLTKMTAVFEVSITEAADVASSPSRYDLRDIPGNRLFCFAQSCKGETC